MIDLRQFQEISTRGAAQRDETYVIWLGDYDSTSCRISLGDKDCSEVIKFIGKSVRLLASPDGEVVIARGDKRLSVAPSGRGTIAASKLVPVISEKFPEFKRIPLRCRWEQDGEGNKVYLLTPNGDYEKRERIVTGRRLEDKR